MTSNRPGPSQLSARTCAAAAAMAAIAVSYAVLSVYYFYADFFQFLGQGAATTTERTGWLVLVDSYAPGDGYLYYLWSNLSPWRIVGAVLAVSMLGVSAVSLWYNRPRARALSLIALWGVLLPQMLWYAEFVIDWHQGQGLADVVATSLFVCTLPTLLLIRPGRPLADWACAHPGRLLGFSIALGWIGFMATEFLDHSYQLESWTAYSGALGAVLLSTLAVKGIYSLRSWGLWAGVFAAASLALIPLAASWTTYVGSGIGQGYIDGFRANVAGSDYNIAMSMVIPVAVLWILAAPFLHGFLRKLRVS